jgi:hypothetical protein
MAKDLGLALQAEPALLPDHLPVSNLVKEIYLRLTSDPAFSNKDFSVVYDWLANNHAPK